MALSKTVVITIVVVILLLIFIAWLSKDSSSIGTYGDAMIAQTIPASSLDTDDTTSNFTYSMWINVKDWNYRYGEPKTILSRSSDNGPPSPLISLGAFENDVTTHLAVYGTNSSTAQHQQCRVKNIPLQKWVNIIVSLYGRSLDIYIDGKLVRTCVLNNTVKTTNGDIQLCPDGGFSGWISNVKFWGKAKNPQEAYNIYKAGYGSGGSLGDLFNKYRIKFVFLVDNQDKGSFEI